MALVNFLELGFREIKSTIQMFLQLRRISQNADVQPFTVTFTKGESSVDKATFTLCLRCTFATCIRKIPGTYFKLILRPHIYPMGANECPFGLHWVSIHQYTFLLLYGIVHKKDLFKSASSIPFFCSLIEC